MRLTEPGTWPSELAMARLGLGLYGYSGFSQGFLPEAALVDVLQRLALTPAMGLKARIAHLQPVAAGEGVSYGAHFVAPREGVRLLATLPVGYADGLPRALSQRISGWLRGARVPQVGVITMDQLAIDVSALESPEIGETVTLLGPQDACAQSPRITLGDWTQALSVVGYDAIEYELMCALRVRLPKPISAIKFPKKNLLLKTTAGRGRGNPMGEEPGRQSRLNRASGEKTG